jgi:hypothetical protein
MKKLIIIILLLPLFAKAQTYQLNYDSIRVNKTAGTGGTSLYGKVYLKNVGLGLVSDSILTVLNGRIRKVPVAGIVPTLGTSAISLGGTANGLSYSAGNYRLHKVTATTGGVLTTGTDTIGGNKRFTNSGSGNTVNIDHTSGSGIGLTITKGGNGEGLIVNKTSGSGNAVAVTGGNTELVGLTASSVSVTADNGLSGVFANNATNFETIRATNSGSGLIASFRNSGGAVASISNSGGMTLSGNISAPNLGTASTYTAQSNNGALTIPLRDLSGDFAAGTITAALIGNASTATALQTARNIQGVSFNGTADINPINGTGFVKASGTTLSYDNNTYLTTSTAASTYLPLSGGTLTGGLTGTTATFTGNSYLATTSGQVGIGTASPPSGFKLEVVDAAPARFTVTSDATTATYGGVAFKRNTSTNGNGNGFRFDALDSNNDNAEYGYIGSVITQNASEWVEGDIILAPTVGGTRTEALRSTSAGDLTIRGSNATKASGTAWINPSDLRLKTNVGEYSKGLNEVLNIHPKTWYFNKASGFDQTKKHLSPIAQELKEIMPEMVTTYKGKLNGKEAELLQVDASDMTWLLVKAIQEQQAIIESLKARITALELK